MSSVLIHFFCRVDVNMDKKKDSVNQRLFTASLFCFLYESVTQQQITFGTYARS